MTEDLLEYEFWDQEQNYYQKFFGLIFPNDLNTIRSAIAKKINDIKKEELNWLDIGTGDGWTLSNILDRVPNKKINLFIIEPSEFTVDTLKKRLESYKNVTFNIITKKFDSELIKDKVFDCATIMHACYYLADHKEEYQAIYQDIYKSLNKNGFLLIQNIADDSDFQVLGNKPYVNWALGDTTFNYLQELWGSNVDFEKYPIRFEVTEYLDELSKKIQIELVHLDRFVCQKDKAILSFQQIKHFQDQVKALAIFDQGKSYLDFKDCLVIANNPKIDIIS
ncbi:MAG: methyltransferase domain-containing protein [Candidatus Margulisiibacteriota bacterium]|jgi:SAM-dependent methyltransferase